MKGVRRILIINGKGGCGKTTIATNLAVAYAQAGRRTALMDYDSQASSTDWSELRNATALEQASASNPSAQTANPPILPLQVVPMHRRVGMYQTRAFSHQLANDVERIIIDTPSGARERDIDTLIKQSDIILVPMLPSPLDIRSGSRFIAELLTHRGFRANPRALGVIANRLQPDLSATSDSGQTAPNEQKLRHALECLNVPCVANFADSTLYARAAEEGRGITELKVVDQASIAEQARWSRLIDWVEAQPKRTGQVAAPRRAVASSASAARAEPATVTHELDNEATA